MSKKLIIAILSFSLPLLLRAQPDTSFQLALEIKGEFTNFSVDNLDNIYLLDNRNQLKKLNPQGDSIAVYNQVRKYGKATLIDASNPLKVLLYYQDFSTIVVLDRLLNIRNTIDLRKHNIFQVKAIGQSYDNNIWLFDEMENKLKKIDEEGKLIQETPDFRLLLGHSFSPLSIFDQDKYVYLYDPLRGVYVFDYYGSLKNGIQILNWENFKVTGNYIFGSVKDTLYRYDIRSFQYDEWKLPSQITTGTLFNFSSTRFYALRKEGLSVYTIR